MFQLASMATMKEERKLTLLQLDFSPFSNREQRDRNDGRRMRNTDGDPSIVVLAHFAIMDFDMYQSVSAASRVVKNL